MCLHGMADLHIGTLAWETGEGDIHLPQCKSHWQGMELPALVLHALLPHAKTAAEYRCHGKRQSECLHEYVQKKEMQAGGK